MVRQETVSSNGARVSVHLVVPRPRVAWDCEDDSPRGCSVNRHHLVLCSPIRQHVRQSVVWFTPVRLDLVEVARPRSTPHVLHHWHDKVRVCYSHW
eukprot:1542373-Rhodomonas_salina.1